ncbi:hypothetical protein PSPO01_13855 [Paraphaeosphaeria sporulosa]
MHSKMPPGRISSLHRRAESECGPVQQERRRWRWRWRLLCVPSNHVGLAVLEGAGQIHGHNACGSCGEGSRFRRGGRVCGLCRETARMLRSCIPVLVRTRHALTWCHVLLHPPSPAPPQAAAAQCKKGDDTWPDRGLLKSQYRALPRVGLRPRCSA